MHPACQALGQANKAGAIFRPGYAIRGEHGGGVGMVSGPSVSPGESSTEGEARAKGRTGRAGGLMEAARGPSDRSGMTAAAALWRGGGCGQLVGRACCHLGGPRHSGVQLRSRVWAVLSEATWEGHATSKYSEDLCGAALATITAIRTFDACSVGTPGPLRR